MVKRMLPLIISCICIINLTHAQTTQGVGIGTTTIDPSAILQIVSSNKGVLFPKISLTSKTDIVTIENPSVGLLVYNTGTGGLDIPGYVYWTGTEWEKLTLTTVVNPVITGLLCNRAEFSPATFTAGVPYEGIMAIPYTGGNGGAYSSGTPMNSLVNTGLTATRETGVLATGSGQLVFRLTGTPAYSSPTVALFNINELGFNCIAALTGQQIEVGQQLSFIASLTQAQNVNGTILSSYYPTQLPTVDGLRMDLISNGAGTYYPRVYNISSEQKIVSFQTFSVVGLQNVTNLNRTIYKASEVTSTNWDYVNVTARATTPIFNVAWSSTTSSTVVTDLQVQITPSVWRWYEMTWWAMEINTVKIIFMSLVRKS